MNADAAGPADVPMTAYSPPPTFTEQAVRLWHGITRSPGRSALATLAAGALFIGVIALIPITTYTRDGTVTLKARCGISYYVGGHSTSAVETACRHAYNSRAVTVAVTFAALAVAVGGLCWSFLREARGHGPGLPVGLRRLIERPRGAALLTLSALLGVIVVLSLRTVPVQVADNGGNGPVTAHCGVGYFVLGADSVEVQTACRDRYAGHALTLFAAVAALAVCGYLMRRLVRAATPTTTGFGITESEGAALNRRSRPHTTASDV